ncbi:hypothetical protein [Sorangium sp. So ce887]|uniref:hypothetical protein n=1 Tax=Sorangium sp. So ce887 TaxID=3133324 RepID=UPI003F60584D
MTWYKIEHRLSQVRGIFRALWEHSGLEEERIYLGGYEVYCKRNTTGLVLEQPTLHVMDGARRVAVVETKTVDTSGPFTVTPKTG